MTTQVAQSSGQSAGAGGLPPLEYIDCYLDSPVFRDVISLYEKEMESNYYLVKNLVRQCDAMIQATKEFSKAQQTFAQALGSFKFQTIGEQSEDEKNIAQSLQTFSRLLMTIEDHRHNMLSTISVRLLQTLEQYRKEQIQKAREDKKRFDKATERYYDCLQKYLSTSAKKNLLEADSNIERENASYRQTAFEYVCRLQDVHAQKQYELIEPIIGYIGDVSTFLHQSYDSALSIKPEQIAVQFKVQILRETNEKEMEKAYQLKAKVIEEGEQGLVHHPDYLRQGHVYIYDAVKKVAIHSWHRYFCQFRKKEIAGKKVRQVRFFPIGHQGQMPSQDFMEVKSCVRCKTEEIDRRFCFDLEVGTTNGNRKYTIQALSGEDRKGWMEVMEGKEPVYTSLKVIETNVVNEAGIDFLERCFETIESRGLEEQGLYRRPGVMSKATKLYKESIEKNKMVNLTDEFEWDTKTIASAIKGYLGKQLGEPLMTFGLHQKFIDAAKIPNHEERRETIRNLVDKLPELNRKMLVLLIKHLKNISNYSETNLMKPSNLGVCFGPTLMRPERESVASIVDIKYQNVIVQEMIEQMDVIFFGAPSSPSQPSVPPPKIPKRNEPPSRPVPPICGNPNIPPPSITRYSDKSPEPIEGQRSGIDSERRRPPVPPSKPPDISSRTSHTSPPTTPINNKSVRRKDSNGPVRPDIPPRPTADSPPSRPPRKNRWPSARALYDCDAEDTQELSFKKGEYLYEITDSEEPDWYLASRSDGQRGLVPANYMEMLNTRP